MNRLLCCFICLLLPLLLPAAGAPTDAIIDTIAKTYTMHADGSLSLEVAQHVTVLTNSAYDTYGESFINYNPLYQRLSILKAETTMASGRKVPSPANAFNEMLPFAAHRFPAFAHLRCMVVTHPAMEKGCAIDLAYRIDTKPGFVSFLTDIDDLYRPVPIKSSTVTIIIPSAKQLHFIAPAAVTPQIKEENGLRRYTFHFDNLPAYRSEPLASHFNNPIMAFSTADPAAEIFAGTDASTSTPAIPIKALAMKLKDGASGNLDCLYRAQAYVANAIETVNLGATLTGTAQRDAIAVLATKYGTMLEKAVLLNTLLHALDLPAEILAVYGAASQEAPTVYAPGLFDQILVRSQIGSDSYFLNPAHAQNNLRVIEQPGYFSFNLSSAGFTRLPATAKEDNLCRINGQLKLEANKSSGVLCVTLKGAFVDYRAAMENVEQTVKTAVNAIIPIRALKIKQILCVSEAEIAITADIEADLLSKLDEHHLLMKAPRLPLIAKDNLIQLQRRSVLPLSCPFQYELDVTVSTPADFTVHFNPQPIGAEPGSPLTFSITAVDQQHVRLQTHLSVANARILPADYPKFRANLQHYFATDTLLWLSKK